MNRGFNFDVSGGQGKKREKAKNRILSFRVDEEDYRRFEALAEFQGTSVSLAARSYAFAGLDAHLDEDSFQQGFREGMKRGLQKGKETYGTPFHCGKCGKKSAYIEHPDDIKALQEAVEKQHWHCPECDDRTGYPEKTEIETETEDTSSGAKDALMRSFEKFQEETGFEKDPENVVSDDDDDDMLMRSLKTFQEEQAADERAANQQADHHEDSDSPETQAVQGRRPAQQPTMAECLAQVVPEWDCEKGCYRGQDQDLEGDTDAIMGGYYDQEEPQDEAEERDGVVEKEAEEEHDDFDDVLYGRDDNTDDLDDVDELDDLESYGDNTTIKSMADVGRLDMDNKKNGSHKKGRQLNE